MSAGNLIEFYRLWPCHIPNRSTGAIMVTRQLVSAFSTTDILGAALWLSSSDYDRPSKPTASHCQGTPLQVQPTFYETRRIILTSLNSERVFRTTDAKRGTLMMIPSIRDRLMAGRGIGWRVARTGLLRVWYCLRPR